MKSITNQYPGKSITNQYPGTIQANLKQQIKRKKNDNKINGFGMNSTYAAQNKSD